MTSSELRIGNIVQNVYKDTFGISQETLCDFANGYVNLKPITLTEEWLLKFGFKEYIDFGCKTKQFDLLPLQGFSYNIDNKKVRVMHKGNSQSHWLKNSIEYVHQLQNLYFALTGEELKIK